MVSIRDILEIPDFALRLLAGAAATDAPVRWVVVADAPSSTASLKGGELLLTHGEVFADCVGRPEEGLAEIIGKDVVGVGFGVGHTHERVPTGLVAGADAAGLPLFEVPRHIPLNSLAEVVTTKIVNAQYSLLQRSAAVHEKLTTLLLEEQGIDAVTATLATLVRCSCTLFGFHGEVLSRASAGAGTPAAGPDDMWRLVADQRLSRTAFSFPLDSGEHALVVPVMVAHRIGAFLVVLKEGTPFGDYDRLIVHHAVTAVALELVKMRAVSRTQQRLVGDFLDQLVARRLSEGEIARQLTFFGLDPAASHVVVLVDRDDAGAARAGVERAERDEEATSERLHWAADEVAAELGFNCLTTARDGRVILVIERSQDGREDIEALGRALLEAADDVMSGGSVSVGIGRPHESVIDLRRSYFEAYYALRLRRLRGDRGAIADHRDLGSYSLLLGLQDASSLEVFCESVLGRLRRHDDANGGDLVASLEAFLECNGHWGDAAEKLYVHRHTLRYRMRRVEEITGRDLDEPQDRMEFWLALKAKEFVEEARDQTAP